MDEGAVRRASARMAHEIVESNQGVIELCLIGIQRRGVLFAAYLADEIEKAESRRPAVGILDITLYPDDLSAVGPRQVLGETRLSATGIDDRNVVIVDEGRHITGSLGCIVQDARLNDRVRVVAGRIGRPGVDRAKAFGMRVIYWSHTQRQDRIAMWCWTSCSRQPTS
ncbi:MAG: phosphoribosyltransferase family protein [Gemmatimonadota bacterium]